MPKIMVIWTALPNGFIGTSPNRRIRLSVYVSMRLQTDDFKNGKLAAFPLALKWPTLVQPDTVDFLVGAVNQKPGEPHGNVPNPSLKAKIISIAPDIVLWNSLFTKETRVVSHQPDDLNHRPINTYSVSALHDHLRRGYQHLTTTSPVALPTRQLLQTAFPELHAAFNKLKSQPAIPLPDEVAPGETEKLHRSLAEHLFRPGQGTDRHQNVARAFAAARQLAETGSPGKLVPAIADNSSLTSRLAQFYGFHHRLPTPKPPLVDPAKVLDFHQALAALAQYPELLKLLGLVIDLELPDGSLPPSPPDGSRVVIQIVPKFSPALNIISASPLTAYILDNKKGIFTSAPRNKAKPETIAGFLNLSLPNAYDLVQVDTDGMVVKAMHMASGQALRKQGHSPDDSDGETQEAGSPAIRTSGISLVHNGHADGLVKRFDIAHKNNRQLNQDPNNPVTLFSEDLTRGYRFDILDDASGNWRSLHARSGTYVFSNHPTAPYTLHIDDEGLSQPTAVQRPDGSPDIQAQLYIHESLMHWQNWSLSAPRPGKTIKTDKPDNVSSQPVKDGIQLEVNFEATPGTLPRLRFGHNYRLRARAVDLAGNSLTLDDANKLLEHWPNTETPPVLPTKGKFTYRRFEPIISPVLVGTEKFTEEESLERLIIRSNRGESSTACASRLMALVAAKRPKDKVIYTGINDRHIVPPKIAQLMAETSSLLDDAFGKDKNEKLIKSMYNLSKKEKGRLTDNKIFDYSLNEDGRFVNIPDTTGIDPLTGKMVTRKAVEFIETGRDSNGPNGYAVHHEPQLQLPYLPDPFSRGATLCGLPGVPVGHFGALKTQDNSLGFSKSKLPQSTLSILGSVVQIDFVAAWPERLPFRLRLAEPSTSDGNEVPPTWDSNTRVLTVHLAKAEQTTIRLSSFINPDDLDRLGIWRWALDRNDMAGLQPPNPGETMTAHTGGMWMLTPFRKIKLVHAVQQPLSEPKFQPNSVVVHREPNATFAYFGASVSIHGKSTEKLDLLASWHEQVDHLEPSRRSAHVYEVPIHLTKDSAISSHRDQDDTVSISNYDVETDTVTFLAKPPNDQSGRKFLSRHEFGDTKHRRVSYKLIATSRFQDYFPKEVTEVTREGAPVTVDIPSTARPAAPKVLYVLPVFEWSRKTSADGSQVSKRKGGGVRVYLQQPWYSSGEGELLGVVLALPKVNQKEYPSEELLPVVSHWGNDPIWKTDPVMYPKTVDDLGKFFPGAQLAHGLELDALNSVGQSVSIAGYPVEFDDDRKLWSCDIHINTGQSYCPFVRFALARYQPHSIHDVELSSVVLTDLVQLLPDRTVKVKPVPGKHETFEITVEGLTYQGRNWDPGPFPNLEDDGVVTEVIQPPPHPPDMTPPNLVQVSLEQRIPGTKDDVGWEPFAEAKVEVVAAASANGSSGTLLWNGEVALPKARSPGQFRVVIREYEHLATDERFGEFYQVKVNIIDPDPAAPDHGHIEPRPLDFAPGAPSAPTPRPGRMVFAETIVL